MLDGEEEWRDKLQVQPSELADANVKRTHPHKTSLLTFHEKQAVHLSVTEKSFKFMVKAVISHPRPPPTFFF